MEIAGAVEVGFGFVDREGEVFFEVDELIFEFLACFGGEMVVDFVDHIVGLDGEFGDAVERAAGEVEALLYLVFFQILGKNAIFDLFEMVIDPVNDVHGIVHHNVNNGVGDVLE